MADGSAATIRRLLADATATLREAGSASPRLDAELLLGHALGIDRAGLLASSEVVVSASRADDFRHALERRGRGEPVAYIRGIKEFFGLAFTVDARALIPRPETERLVEVALERIRDALVERARPAGSAPLRVWDVGTGSGAIAVSLAVECRRRGYAADVRLLATDVAGEALGLATENAVGHGVADMVTLRAADLAELDSRAAADWLPVDVLCANLPYIPTDVLPTLPVAASYEPAAALDGGHDGLAIIRRLLAELPRLVTGGGVALLEIGGDQAEEMAAASSEALPGWSMTLHHDLSGLPRVVELRSPAMAGA